jgi:hypothetical protein
MVPPTLSMTLAIFSTCVAGSSSSSELIDARVHKMVPTPVKPTVKTSNGVPSRSFRYFKHDQPMGSTVKKQPLSTTLRANNVEEIKGAASISPFSGQSQSRIICSGTKKKAVRDALPIFLT